MSGITRSSGKIHQHILDLREYEGDYRSAPPVGSSSPLPWLTSRSLLSPVHEEEVDEGLHDEEQEDMEEAGDEEGEREQKEEEEEVEVEARRVEEEQEGKQNEKVDQEDNIVAIVTPSKADSGIDIIKAGE